MRPGPVGKNASKAILTLVILVASLGTGCSSSGGQISDQATDLSVSPTTDSSLTQEVLATEDWVVDSAQTDLVLSNGGKARLKVSIGEVVRVRNPDQDISPECPVEDLPPEGTAFQRFYIEIESLANRPMSLISLFGYAEGSRFTSLWRNAIAAISNVDGPCLPKDMPQRSAPIVSGLEGSMRPGSIVSMDIVVSVRNADWARFREYSWGVLASLSREEAEDSLRLSIDSLLDGSAFVRLATFGSSKLSIESVEEDEDSTGSPIASTEELVCDELRGLQAPASQGSVDTLQGHLDGLSPSLLLKDYVVETVTYYRDNPTIDRYPVSRILALMECDANGW